MHIKEENEEKASMISVCGKVLPPVRMLPLTEKMAVARHHQAQFRKERSKDKIRQNYHKTRKEVYLHFFSKS